MVVHLLTRLICARPSALWDSQGHRVFIAWYRKFHCPSTILESSEQEKRHKMCIVWNILPVRWAFIPHCYNLKLPFKLTEPRTPLFLLSSFIHFLSFTAWLSSFHFLTTSSSYRYLLHPHVWPSLGTEDKQPSGVGYLSLHVWLPLGDHYGFTFPKGWDYVWDSLVVFTSGRA